MPAGVVRVVIRRATLVPLLLSVVALVHAIWGMRMLLLSNVMVGGTQLVSAGGLLFAAISLEGRPGGGAAIGFGVAAGATAVRSLASLATGGGPFLWPGMTLAVGMAAVAWAAARLHEGDERVQVAASLRGGALAMAIAYLGYAGVGAALGVAEVSTLVDLGIRAVSIAAFALLVDAPRLVPAKEKTFEDAAAMRAR